MTAKRIAIIGNIDPDRAEELALEDLEDMTPAAEALGLQLAQAGYHLVVYSSAEGALEVSVVRGYAGHENAADGSIRVVHSSVYSTKNPRPNFAESQTHSRLFDYDPDPSESWVASFYQSIAGPKVDGVLLMGGGRATMIPGLVAAGQNKPILTVGRFGGAAKQLWRILSQQSLPYVTEDQWNLMARSNWSAETPRQQVDLLAAQFARLEELALEDNAPELDRESNRYAFIAVPLLLAIVVAWVISQSITSITPVWLYTLLGAVPVAGGIVGSSARMLLNDFNHQTTEKRPRISENLTLGLIAGVISAFIFLGAQVSSLATLDLQPEQLAQQLKPLVLYTALVSMAGGFALESVFGRLRDINPEEIRKPADADVSPSSNKDSNKQP